MARVERFEDLTSWQKARALARFIYTLTRRDGFRQDYGLSGQIQRAAGSIMHNIAEGFESGSDPEFRRFLKIAKRSASEVQSQLYLALDCNYISQEEFYKAYALAEEVKRLINGLLGYLGKSHHKKKRPPP